MQKSHTDWTHLIGALVCNAFNIDRRDGKSFLASIKMNKPLNCTHVKLLMADTALLLLINDKRREEIAVDGVEKIDQI